MNVVLLTAGGIGSRMKQEIPKQFLHVNNKPIIVYTMEAFEKNPNIDAIIVSVLENWENVLWAYAKQYNISKLKWVVVGGESGQKSIYNGLVKLREEGIASNDMIMIHDGNRPLISQDIITDSIATYKKYGSAVAAIPCVEVVFKSKDGIESNEVLERNELIRTQTPHTYAFGDIYEAHQMSKKLGLPDSAASCYLMNQLGRKVYFSLGSEINLKITTMDDLNIFESLIANIREK